MIYTIHGFAGRTSQFDFITTEKVDIDLFELKEFSLAAIEAKIDFSKEVKLIGYSLGARLAAQIFLRNADSISQCLLLAGHMGLSSEEDKKNRIDIESNFKDKLRHLSQEEFISFWNSLELFSHDHSERIRYEPALLFKMIEQFALTKQPYLIPSLAAYKEKIHFFYGEKDTKYFQYAQSELSDFNVHTFADAGHRVYQYESVKNKILEVLQ
ncbi:MAG: hypothetical protein CME62_05150 [Halobacteriovoraceae bacterium]|nr:hypothetical protein [Halobacteriovoraceae bacterium]|tara:strand:- start:5678 stop:6313 length:636 start_codon:yes stop_codon:yes gene_type:complete